MLLRSSRCLGPRSSLPCFLPHSSLERGGLAKLHKVPRSPSLSRTKGIGVGGAGNAGLQGRPCKTGRSASSGRPGPNSFEERPLGAKVSGNGVWGSRRPESKASPHCRLRPHGLCSRPHNALVLARALAHACTRAVVVVGGADSESLRPRSQHHTPRAHHTHSRLGSDVLPPPPASRVDAERIRHPALAKAPQTANHRARGALGGKLSLEGLGGWGQEGSQGERQGEGPAGEGFCRSRPHPWHPMKTNGKEAPRRWEDTSGFPWRRLLMASVLLRAPQT